MTELHLFLLPTELFFAGGEDSTSFLQRTSSHFADSRVSQLALGSEGGGAATILLLVLYVFLVRNCHFCCIPDSSPSSLAGALWLIVTVMIGSSVFIWQMVLQGSVVFTYSLGKMCEQLLLWLVVMEGKEAWRW